MNDLEHINYQISLLTQAQSLRCEINTIEAQLAERQVEMHLLAQKINQGPLKSPAVSVKRAYQNAKVSCNACDQVMSRKNFYRHKEATIHQLRLAKRELEHPGQSFTGYTVL